MFPVAFGFGGPTDIAIIAIVVMVLFGGSKLASLGKGTGEGIREFKKAMRDDDDTPAPPALPATVPPATTVTEEKEAR